MLDEVIKGVKQRSSATLTEKKAHWPWKNRYASVWKDLTIFV